MYKRQTPDSKYALIQQTIVTLFDYLGKSAEEIPPLSLESTGKMERDGKKVGIGSSGSVTAVSYTHLDVYKRQVPNDIAAERIAWVKEAVADELVLKEAVGF